MRFPNLSLSRYTLDTMKIESVKKAQKMDVEAKFKRLETFLEQQKDEVKVMQPGTAAPHPVELLLRGSGT